MKVPCYEQVFYTTNGSWKVAYKILKADTTEDLQVFDDIVRSVEISAYDITLKYKGGMEFKDFLGDPDQNTWMGLVPGDPEFVYTLDPEVAPENYLESAPFLMSKDLLGSYFDAGKLIVGSSYEIKGKLDTVIEGGPPTYKFYILTGFKKV
jgi:hypothetical protein